MIVKKSKIHNKKQKNRIFIYNFTLFILIFTFFSGCIAQDITNIDSKGKNVICFGDSITAGEGAGPGEAYPGYLAKKLAPYPVIRSGVDGEITTEALERIQSDVLDKDPLLVIIEYGGNDFLRKIPLEKTLENLEKMIKLCQRKGAMVALCEMRAGIIMKEYTPLYRKLARKYKTIVVPNLLSGIWSNPKLLSDVVHPNAQGYELIATKVYWAIKPALLKNQIERNKT